MPAPPPHRSLAVWAAVTTAATAAAVVLAPVAVTPGPGFAGALVQGCAAVALLAVGWLWLGATVTVAAVTRGREAPFRGVPAPVRRLVLAACGVALAGGLVAGPAHATPGRPQEGGTSDPAAGVSGLPLPDRAVAPEPRAAAERRTAVVVTVSPGDSLWAIAARQHPGASDAEVDAAWRRIYALNRSAIGADPDLITPALRLRMPVSEVLP